MLFATNQVANTEASFNYDKAALIVSVFAIILTLLNWGYDLWKRKTKLSVKIIDDDPYACAAHTTLVGHSLYGKNESYMVLIPIVVSNRSAQEISITDIIFYGSDEKEYCASYRPHTESWTLDSKPKTESTAIPFTLLSMQAKHVTLHLYAPVNASFTSSTIFTSKRKVVSPQLALAANNLIDKKRNVKDDRSDSEN